MADHLTGLFWRRIAFLLLAVWISVSVLVIFFRGLPEAKLEGSAEQTAAQFQPYLGSGWYPLEVDSYNSATKPTHLEWIGINLSSGKRSTLKVPSDWRVLSLRLLPVCANGQRQRLVVTQGSRTLRVVTLPYQWAWYTIHLGSTDATVVLQYACVSAQPVPGRGLRAARQIAVVVAGIQGD